ncbi:MAG: sigma-54-dependent transcriptional regulator, partial [Candidatus Aminicenantaceae bacterium]
MAEEIIHIIDDEPIIHEVLGDLLTSEGFDTEISSGGEEALKKFDSQSYGLVLLDLLMPGMDGMEVLERVKTAEPNLPVVMLTATKTVRTAVEAMKLGAFDYLTKPFDVEEVRLVVERATKTAELVEEVNRLRSEVRTRFSLQNIVARSPRMQSVLETVRTIAPLKTTVLI